jgi:4-carboxymuconolactone decarboxylase
VSTSTIFSVGEEPLQTPFVCPDFTRGLVPLAIDGMLSRFGIAITSYPRGDRHMAQKKPTVYEFIPKLGQLRDDVLFGDVWEHPDLSKRDRSLITVAMLAALYRTDEMRGHMQRALDNGVTQTELKGLITHVAFYAGWPCAVNAGRVAIEVFGPK